MRHNGIGGFYDRTCAGGHFGITLLIPARTVGHDERHTVSTRTLATVTLSLNGTEYACKQGVDGAVWPRPEDGGGSAARIMRWVNALAVLSAATGQPIAEEMVCPLTGETFNIFHGAEVDRLHGEESPYTFGNVMLVSIAGNQGRAYAQSRQTDIPQIDAYARLVALGSERVGFGLGGYKSSPAGRLYAAGGKRGNRTTTYGQGYRFNAYTRIVEFMARTY